MGEKIIFNPEESYENILFERKNNKLESNFLIMLP